MNEMKKKREGTKLEHSMGSLIKRSHPQIQKPISMNQMIHIWCIEGKKNTQK
jgi:hypothetical protein